MALAAVMLIVCAGGILFGLSFRGDFFGAGAGAGAGAGTDAGAQPSPPGQPSPSAANTGPKAVAERFLTATVAGDRATADENLCRLLRGNGGLDSDNQNWLTYLVSFQIGEESVKGPAASVEVKLTVPVLGEIPFELYLIKEDNAWRVCGLGPS